jgi:hypothetical protein
MKVLSHALQFYKWWSSWLGDGGKPVAQQLAQSRADTCRICPLNKEMSLITLLAEGVASTVHRQMEIRNNLKLRVEGEHELHICSACSCVLGLKIWSPIRHVLDNTDLSDLHPQCWILKETNNTQSPCS